MLDLTRIPYVTLDDVRQALGLEAGDTSKDARISRMTPKEFVGFFAQWHLGNARFGRQFYELVHDVDAAVTDTVTPAG